MRSGHPATRESGEPSLELEVGSWPIHSAPCSLLPRARQEGAVCREGWHRLRGEGTGKIHLSRPSVGAKAVTLLGLAPSSRGEIFAPHQAKLCLDLD